jgi:hypothetical protein
MATGYADFTAIAIGRKMLFIVVEVEPGLASLFLYMGKKYHHGKCSVEPGRVNLLLRNLAKFTSLSLQEQ